MVKRTVVLMICLALLVSACKLGDKLGKTTKQQQDNSGLFPIFQDNKLGFINSSGQVVINPQFESKRSFDTDPRTLLFISRILRFSGGFGRVIIGEKVGYIDNTGKYQINPQFAFSGDFNDGLAVAVNELKDGKFGYIDTTGKFVITPQFDSEPKDSILFGNSDFSDGLALVNVGKKFGFIDKTGKFVVNPQFEMAGKFSDGLAPIKLEGKWGYIDKTGKIVINPQFGGERRPVGDFSEGLAAVEVDKDKWGFIDKSGKIVINPQFEYASRFSDGLAMVMIGKKIGYIDTTGKIVINPQFEFSEKQEMISLFGICDFSSGLALQTVGKKYGYIDKTGKYQINPQFDFADRFVNGLALVVVGEKLGYIDTTGKLIWSLSDNSVSSTKRTANENSAIESMRLFHSVEATYQAGIGNASFGNVQNLFYQDFIDPVLAAAGGCPATTSIGQQKCTGDGAPKSGYNFRLTYTRPDTGTLSRFTAIATPAVQTGNSRTGERCFFVDETGVIRASTTATQVPDASSSPLNR